MFMFVCEGRQTNECYLFPSRTKRSWTIAGLYEIEQWRRHNGNGNEKEKSNRK